MKTNLLKTFLRHAALASAWLLAILCVFERLAPGSVLAYFNLNWLALLVLVLIPLLPEEGLGEEGAPRRMMWKWVVWIPFALALATFLAFVAADTGESGRLLVLVAGMLAVAFLIVIAYRKKD